jgi:hypothetical protein
MVKKPVTPRGPMPDINRDGTPRAKPGKLPRPEDVKSDRIIMRVHSDLLMILDARAKERGLTRSKYLEQLLIGWAKSDPRNWRLDSIGRRIPNLPAPRGLRKMDPLKFADRWQKFATAHTVLFGAPPPSDWFDQDDNYLPDDLNPLASNYTPRREPK